MRWMLAVALACGCSAYSQHNALEAAAPFAVLAAAATAGLVSAAARERERAWTIGAPASRPRHYLQLSNDEPDPPPDDCDDPASAREHWLCSKLSF